MSIWELYNEVPCGVVIGAVENGKLVYANATFLKCVGCDSSELLSKKVEDLFTKVPQKMEGNDFITSIKSTSRSVHIKTSVVNNPQDNNSYYVFFVEPLLGEIPDQVYLTAILDSFQDVIYFKDKKSRFLRVNRAFKEQYGKGIDDLAGKTDFDLFTDEHAQQAFDDEREILRTEKGFYDREEKEVNLYDGSVSWVSTSKMPFYNGNHLIGTFGISKNITQLKLAQRHAMENLNILREITRNMPMVIFNFGKNSETFEYIGQKEIITCLKKSKVAKLTIEDNLSYILDVVSNGEEASKYTSFSSCYNDGKSVLYFDNYVFETNPGENKYVGISIDVTEKKYSNHVIKRHSKKLEKINKELNDFAYIISHDLKAPLRAITNLSEWIEEDLENYENADVKENLHLLRSRVARLQNLINGILSYSRASRDVARETIDVKMLVKEVVELLEVPKGFDVEIASELPQIEFNRTNLERIFMNLISNAYKHHDKTAGKIKIEYQELKDFHEFAVTDDGPGIDPEYHEKVFVIFQTLKARDKFESTGIGLTIVKKILEDCGGEIKLKSELGKGARFIFRIPKKLD